MPQTYDLGQRQRAYLPSETQARQISNLERQQMMGLRAAQEQRAAALAPHQIESTRLGNQLKQEQIIDAPVNRAAKKASTQNIKIQSADQARVLESETDKRLSLHANNIIENTQPGTPEYTHAVAQFHNDIQSLADQFEKIDPNLFGGMTKLKRRLATSNPDDLVKEFAIRGKQYKELAKGARKPEIREHEDAVYEVPQPDGTVKYGRGYTGTYVNGQLAARQPLNSQLFDSAEEAAESKVAAERSAKRKDKQWGTVTEKAEEVYDQTRTQGALVDQMETILEGVRTGQGAQIGVAAKNMVRFFGGEDAVSDNELANISALKALTQDMVAQRIALTKGAVSEMEFKSFIDAVPNLLQTPEGNATILSVMRQMNNFAKKRAMAIREIDVNDDLYPKLSDKRRAVLAFDTNFENNEAKEFKSRLKEMIADGKKRVSKDYTFSDLARDFTASNVPGSVQAAPKTIKQGNKSNFDILGGK